jgi:hypothetical protein
VTTNDHIPASSPPTKSQSVVNDADGERKHTKKKVSRSEHGESCPMYFESGGLHGRNEKKQSSIDGWCCDESKQGVIAIAQVATTQEVGLMTMKIHMMQRMTEKQPLMHCPYRVPIQIKFSTMN